MYSNSHKSAGIHQGERKTSASKAVLYSLIAAVLYLSVSIITIFTLDSSPDFPALWPAAGLALGLYLSLGPTVLPGIFFGCFLFHFSSCMLDHGCNASFALMVSIIEAAIAVLQPRIAGFVYERCNASNAFSRPVLSLVFIFLIIPVAVCLTGALSMISFLLHGKEIPIILAAGGTRILADITGIVIVTPVVLSFTGHPRELWKPRRQWVGIPIFLHLTLLIASYNFLIAFKKTTIESNFKSETLQTTVIVQEIFKEIEANLYYIKTFIESSEKTSRGEFERFFALPLKFKEYIKVFGWTPRVPHASRSDYNLALQREIKEFTGIKGLEKNRVIPFASHSIDYYPVTYFEPTGNISLLGLDLGSHKRLGNYFRRHQHTNRVSFLQLEKRLLTVGAQGDLFITLPVKQNDFLNNTPNQENSPGYLFALTSIEKIIETTLVKKDIVHPEFALVDITDPTEPQRIYLTNKTLLNPEDYSSSKSFEFGDRKLRIFFAPDKASEKLLTLYLLPFLLFGTLFSTALSALLLIITGQQAAVKDLVEQQTRSLREKTHEIEQFLYVASHDLREPLRTIENLASWIEEDEESVLSETSMADINELQTRAQRLSLLLKGLVHYTQDYSQENRERSINSHDLIKTICTQYKDESALTVVIEDTLPSFTTDKFLFESIMRQIIDNAFTHSGERATTIRIGCTEKKTSYEFIINDDGVGIPEQYREKAFEIFQTLSYSQDNRGAGLGLAIAKKIVSRAGGSIHLSSKNESGCRVHVLWPKELVSDSKQPRTLII